MSRGFDLDSFEMDDFRESDSYDRVREIGAGRGGGSLSGASARLELQKLREKETASDRGDSQAEITRTASPDHRDLPLRSELRIDEIAPTAHQSYRGPDPAASEIEALRAGSFIL